MREPADNSGLKVRCTTPSLAYQKNSSFLRLPEPNFQPPETQNFPRRTPNAESTRPWQAPPSPGSRGGCLRFYCRFSCRFNAVSCRIGAFEIRQIARFAPVSTAYRRISDLVSSALQAGGHRFDPGRLHSGHGTLRRARASRVQENPGSRR